MLRFAIGNLLSRPLRSLLSLVGLAVAIGGMVALFAIAGGLDHVVRRTFDQIPGLLVQQRGAPVPLFSTLPAEWGSEIRELPGVAVVDPQVITRVNLIDNRPIITPPRFAVGADLKARAALRQDLYRNHLVSGRALDEGDIGSNRCLISRMIAEEFNKEPGQTLKVNRFECEIVGIYHTGSIMLDGNIVLDINTVRDFSRIAADTVACFYVEAGPDVDRQALKQQIESHFQNRDLEAFRFESASGGVLNLQQGNLLGNLVRALDRAAGNDREPQTDPPEKSSAQPLPETDSAEPGPVEVRIAEDWAERIAEFSTDLDMFLGLITAVGLLIALLSIVNTMMMSVTERTTEFGILRANGWSQGHIVRLMSLEAGLLGVLGGALGALLGWLATHAVNWRWPERLQLYASPQLILFAILFSTAIGIAGGLYPAWVAARMSPMESIRRG